MEPIIFLTYLAISHYSFSVVSNIYDYIKFQNNFNCILNELAELKCQIERLKLKI